MFFTLFIFSLLLNGFFSVEEFICESENLNIECPVNTFLRIENAIYGRHNSTICPKKGLDQNINCSSTNGTQILQQRCGGRRNCTFIVSNEIFTDPCVGTYKYLDLNYSCVPRFIPRPPIFPPWYQFCRANEEIGCSNPCFRHCAKRNICSDICIRRCVCKQGYKRDSKTDRCVAEQYCPLPGTECDTHEVYSECGAGCQQTCANRNPICTLQCVPGYVCAENYIRNTITKQCVRPEDCPLSTRNCTGSNEENRCVDPCYRGYCNSPPPPPRCETMPMCTQRCVCRRGYLRDLKTGRCISQQYCPLPGSNSETHEQFSECGAGCQPTCTNRNPVCNRLCVSGYICSTGYIRNSTTRQCIRSNQCRT